MTQIKKTRTPALPPGSPSRPVRPAPRLILLGGETLSGLRYIWWNFVASSKEKIEVAKQAWAEGDWETGRFRLPPGDTQEFILLPDGG